MKIGTLLSGTRDTLCGRKPLIHKGFSYPVLVSGRRYGVDMTQLVDPPSGADAPPPEASVLDGLVAAMARLADARTGPLWPLGTKQLTDALDQIVRLNRQAEAIYLRLLDEIDARGIPLSDGAPNTKSWLRERHRLPGRGEGRCGCRCSDQLRPW
jgi:hypothetical protein